MNSIVTRTILLTDIVGSTSLVEGLGDERAAALFARVDRAVRDAVKSTNGTEIDKTDGFLVLYDRAVDAVRGAVRIHKALEELSADVKRPVRMRCGINVGEVVVRRNADEDVARGAKPVEVEGLVKPMAARIMSLALGGQTLLTRPAHELASRASVGDPELGDMRYTAHGAYRLAGVSEPVEVFEVGARRGKRPPDSDKARLVRHGVRWPLLVLAGVVVAAAGFAVVTRPAALTRVAAGVLTSPVFGGLFDQGPAYTTLERPARVSPDAAVQARFAAAWQAYGQGDVHGARRMLDALAAELPGRPAVRVAQLALTFEDQGQIPRELQESVGAANGPDGDIIGFVERWKVEGWDPEKLHDEIDAFRARHPDHLVGLLLSIGLHREQGRTEEVATLVEELVRSPLAKAVALRARADARVAAGDLDGAEAALQDGLATFPSHPLLTRGLAAVRMQRGQPRAALELLEPLLAKDPSDLAAHAGAVGALLALGRAPELEPHLAALRGPTLTPAERVAYGAEIARSYAAEGQLASAREWLASAAAEARAEALWDAWVDAALQDLRWALDPDLTAAQDRAAALQRAEQALLEPTLSESALRRLREALPSARAVAAWLDGGAPAGVTGPDPFGAAALAAATTAGGTCVEALRRAEIDHHGGLGDEGAAGFARAAEAPCAEAYAIRASRAAAEVHLASLALEAGTLEAARDHVTAFEAAWPTVDEALPVAREAARVKYEVWVRTSGGKPGKAERKAKRR